MKYIPILFSTPMVQAIMDGRKTQTRRTKFLSDLTHGDDTVLHHKKELAFNADTWLTDILAYCPYGKPGDVLWVRETWRETDSDIIFKADATDPFITSVRWKPSIHMPKAAARIFLEVVSRRVERLQDISESDAKAEGIVMNNLPHEGWYWMENVYSTDCPILAYEKLWNSINGNWDENPFVWVVEFKRIEKPKGFL